MKHISQNDKSDIVKHDNLTLLRYKKNPRWLIYTPTSKAWIEILPVKHKHLLRTLEEEFNEINSNGFYTRKRQEQQAVNNTGFGNRDKVERLRQAQRNNIWGGTGL